MAVVGKNIVDDTRAHADLVYTIIIYACIYDTLYLYIHTIYNKYKTTLCNCYALVAVAAAALLQTPPPHVLRVSSTRFHRQSHHHHLSARQIVSFGRYYFMIS